MHSSTANATRGSRGRQEKRYVRQTNARCRTSFLLHRECRICKRMHVVEYLFFCMVNGTILICSMILAQPDGGANCPDGEEAEDESKLAARLREERLELLARYMSRPVIRLLVGCGLAPAKVSCYCNSCSSASEMYWPRLKKLELENKKLRETEELELENKQLMEEMEELELENKKLRRKQEDGARSETGVMSSLFSSASLSSSLFSSSSTSSSSLFAAWSPAATRASRSEHAGDNGPSVSASKMPRGSL
jgi:hypothetical protein